MPRYFSRMMSLISRALGLAVAAEVAGFFVHQFGERFGEAVAEGLGHDRVVVVVLRAEFGGELFDAVAGGDGEAAEESRPPLSFGAMKSESEWLNWSTGFSCCWRRQWKVASVRLRAVSA